MSEWLNLQDIAGINIIVSSIKDIRLRGVDQICQSDWTYETQLALKALLGLWSHSTNIDVGFWDVTDTKNCKFTTFDVAYMINPTYDPLFDLC